MNLEKALERNRRMYRMLSGEEETGDHATWVEPPPSWELPRHREEAASPPEDSVGKSVRWERPVPEGDRLDMGWEPPARRFQNEGAVPPEGDSVPSRREEPELRGFRLGDGGGSARRMDGELPERTGERIPVSGAFQRIGEPSFPQGEDGDPAREEGDPEGDRVLEALSRRMERDNRRYPRDLSGE